MPGADVQWDLQKDLISRCFPQCQWLMYVLTIFKMEEEDPPDRDLQGVISRGFPACQWLKYILTILMMEEKDPNGIYRISCLDAFFHASGLCTHDLYRSFWEDPVRICGDPVRVLPKRPCSKILEVLCMILYRSLTEDLAEILAGEIFCRRSLRGISQVLCPTGACMKAPVGALGRLLSQDLVSCSSSNNSRSFYNDLVSFC